jgi:hypothetical protein
MVWSVFLPVLCWTKLGKQIIVFFILSFIVFVVLIIIAYQLDFGCRSFAPHIKYFTGLIFRRILNNWRPPWGNQNNLK